ncbi:MAG: hypothetical protein IJL26_07680 [Clostridia bacterium]|nr:hypothetical protein [Clostridia bacterium]
MENFDLGKIDIKAIFDAVKKFFAALVTFISAVYDSKKAKVSDLFSF